MNALPLRASLYKEKHGRLVAGEGGPRPGARSRLKMENENFFLQIQSLPNKLKGNEPTQQLLLLKHFLYICPDLLEYAPVITQPGHLVLSTQLSLAAEPCIESIFWNRLYDRHR
jgi:hypothetical protein